MKKYGISIAVVVVIASYIIFQKISNKEVSGNTNSTNSTSINSNNSNSGSNSTGNANTNNNSGTTDSNSNTSYKDGSYTGNIADSLYGNIQVKAIIKSGKISDVQFLQYPNDRGQSIEINEHAMPLLTQEAIKAQDSKVDIISGATDTSVAFIQSLASALTQAKI